MSKKILAAFGILAMSSVLTAPAMAITVSCPGNGVPVVDSVSQSYDGATGRWYTTVSYHCVKAPQAMSSASA